MIFVYYAFLCILVNLLVYKNCKKTTHTDTDSKTKFKWSQNILYFMLIAEVFIVIELLFAVADVNIQEKYGYFYNTGYYETESLPGIQFINSIVVWFVNTSLGRVTAIGRMFRNLPNIIAGILSAYMLYKLLLGYTSTKKALIVTGIFLLNPLYVIHIGVWGITDAILLAGLFGILNGIKQKNLLAVYLSFILTLIFHPAILFIVPVILYVTYDFTKDNKVYLANVLLTFLTVFCVIGAVTMYSDYNMSLPAYTDYIVNGITYLFVGWAKISLSSWVFQMTAWVVVICLGIEYLYKTDRKFTNYLKAIICTLLLTQMGSDRVLGFVIIPLMVLEYFCEEDRDMLIMMGIAGVVYVINFICGMLNITTNILSIITYITSLALAGWQMYKIYIVEVDESTRTFRQGWEEFKYSFFKFSCLSKKEVVKEEVDLPKIKWKDIVIMICLFVVSLGVGASNLGDLKAPSSAYKMDMYDTIDIKMPEGVTFTSVYVYKLYPESLELNVQVVNAEDNEWLDVTVDSVNYYTDLFCNAWDQLFLTNPSTELWIKVRSLKGFNIGEIIFLDEDSNVVTPENTEDYPELFDEQDLWIGDKPISVTSTIFDEAIYTLNMWEVVNDLPNSENTHPPLGKWIQTWGVELFGMTPFGWRITGVFFGALVVPAIYLLAYLLVKDRKLAFCGGVLTLVDCMRFTQSRLGTIDLYPLFFSLVAYISMYILIHTKTNKGKLGAMLATGVSMGLAMASKWTGVYASLGLAIVYLVYLYNTYGKSRERGLLKELLWAFLLMICIPIVIYFLSYYTVTINMNYSMVRYAMENQIDMFKFHSTLHDTHGAATHWWEWPLCQTPMLYSATNTPYVKAVIYAMGNPYIWMMTIPVVGYSVFKVIKDRNLETSYMLLGYLVSYVPWWSVDTVRTTFIYHYLPAGIFLILLIILMFRDLKCTLTTKQYNILLYGYVGLCVITFIQLYPVCAGVNMPSEYFKWNEYWGWWSAAEYE